MLPPWMWWTAGGVVLACVQRNSNKRKRPARRNCPSGCGGSSPALRNPSDPMAAFVGERNSNSGGPTGKHPWTKGTGPIKGYVGKELRSHDDAATNVNDPLASFVQRNPIWPGGLDPLGLRRRQGEANTSDPLAAFVGQGSSASPPLPDPGPTGPVPPAPSPKPIPPGGPRIGYFDGYWGV